MVSTLAAIWIAWFILCPLNILLFLLWYRGKEYKTKEGKLSGGGLQMEEWQMVALFSAIGAVGILLGILQYTRVIHIPIW